MPLTGQAKLDYQREWTAARRRRAADLLGGRCSRCGTAEKLQFDHMDPATKDARLRGHAIRWTWAWQRILAELEKCQLLCEPCHKDKTAAERVPPHGTHGRYVKHRCRCRPCKDAHAEMNAKYRTKVIKNGELAQLAEHRNGIAKVARSNRAFSTGYRV